MLSYLNLDSNDLSGKLDFGIFSEMSSLSYLDLSNNRGLFITNLSTTSNLSSQFRGIYLSSCNIREFPMFLKTQGILEALDLSNNNISNPIPRWLLSVGIETLYYLNLSHNFIRGWEKAPLILPWKVMDTLDLHSNMLHGSLVVPPMSTTYFSISENSLVGRIDPLFCKLRDLRYLDLSSNNLSGTIPQCLGNFSSSLLVLNLRGNNLNGNMPSTCGDGNQLQTLDLSYNNLRGKIPKSLIKCKELHILNLGHNQMTDTFPFMVQSFSKLQVVILSSNKFYGPIWHPHRFFGFVNLNIIDLSFNDFTGSLPSHYFQNWTSMEETSYNKSQLKYIGEGSYSYSVTMINKGQNLPYIRIFTFFMCIDFSNNKFHGEIPRTIGDLQTLVVLNLSSNNFTGPIPPSLGNLIKLESLDLSQNKLSGQIPQQFTRLTFLEYLNLTDNELVGPIPQAGQIGIFENSSFEGNWGLCGPPLSKKCGTSPLPPHDNEKSDDSILSGFGWEAVAIGYGCGLIIGLMLGYMITSRSPYLVFKVFRVTPPRRLGGVNR
nr:receptor like protein 27-like [Ziziphus jujuba var. spinosa]XP_048329059.1 receptor like protein 27-like [Ziziphus jujuba var. spinosa]